MSLVSTVSLRRTSSLSEEVAPGTDWPLGDVLEDTSIPSQYHVVLLRQRRELVHMLLAKLPTRERFIIKRRLGFYDGTEWTLETISKVLHLSKERVRQLERWALHELQRCCDKLAISKEFIGRDINTCSRRNGGRVAKIASYRWNGKPNPGRAHGSTFRRKK